MIHVVDQKVAGLWPVGRLKPEVGGPLLRPAAPDPGLREPYGACLAGRYLAVADAGHDRVALIHRRTGGTTSITLSGTWLGPLKKPRGVAVTVAGTLVVADTGNRRVIWSTATVDELVSDGEAASTWAAFGTASSNGSRGIGDFLAPTGVATDAAGRTWVADPGLGRLVVVDDPSGAGWAEVALPPGPHGIPRQPHAVAREGDHVLLTDLSADEVWQIDADLTAHLLLEGRVKGRLTAPVAICAEAAGFLVADAVGARVVRWSRRRGGALRYAGELVARGRPSGAPVFSRVTGLAVSGGLR